MTAGYIYGQPYTHALGTVPVVWGRNNYGQLGLGSSDAAAHSLPAFVPNTGALASKTVVALALGANHTLALTSEGKVYAWGRNEAGQVGNGTADSLLSTPVAVVGLNDKTVVAITVGGSHSVALCSDGTVYSWGWNYYGQLGNGTTSDSTTPTPTPVAAATGSGSALHGKTVVAVAAGDGHTLALCSDGTLVTWGRNNYGQLGNGTTANSNMPVAVATGSGSALHGKTVVAMAAGAMYSAALCNDGTVATCGQSGSGHLGDGRPTGDYSVETPIPVAVKVDSSSALNGKSVVGLAAGLEYVLTLCQDADGALSLASWGSNSYRQLGNDTAGSLVSTPVAVDMDSGSALYGKTVVALAAGNSHSLALCADGTLATWGRNDFGQLGDGTTTNGDTPKAIDDLAGSALLGRTPYLLAPGSYAYHSAVLVSATPVTAVATPAAGTYKAGDTLSFTLTTAEAVLVTGTPRLALTLGSATVYATCVSGSGTTSLVFTYTVQAGDADADGISVGRAIDWNSGTITDLSGGSIAPILPAYTLPVIAIDTTAPAVPAITSTAPAGITTSAAYTMTGTAEAGATVKIYNAGTLVDTVTADAEGHWSCALTLDDGATALTVTATDAAGNVSTAASDASWTIDTTAPAVATIARTQSGPVTREDTLEWRVTFTEPVTGVDAGDFVVTSIVGGASGTISSVTGSDATYLVTVALAGTGRVRLDLVAAGSGIADAAAISLSADFVRGQVYVASSSAMPVSWGYNGYGQLGDGTTNNADAPLPVLHGAIPTDQPVVSVVCGDSHSVALTEDGGVYAWGYNSYGQLGNSANTTSKVPVAVSALGSKAVAVAAGADFSLALTEAGKVYAWGYNLFGQLGNGTTTNSNAPVEVSALAGKGVVAISAGGGFALALTADGAVYAWGQNVLGQLGNGTYVGTVTTPAQVTGFSGRTVVAISCGASHALALTADGAVYTWGYNYDGQLGNGTTTASNRPAEVTALSGQGVSALQAGTYHSLALTESGTVYAWGRNNEGQLGDNSQTNRLTPVAVGGLSGRGVIELSAGEAHTLALLADGSALICGTNERSVLGDCVVVSPALTPVPVATTNAMVGRSLLALSTDVSRYSVLALASPIQGALSVSPAGGDLGEGASITFTVTFPSAVTVTGSPRLALLVGTETLYATYTSGSGSTSLVFTYTVQSGATDADGIAVASAINLNGGTITDVLGYPTASALPAYTLPTIRVDTTAPAPLTAFAAVATGAGQIEMTFTAPEACTVYFTALEASQTAGTAAQIVAGQDAAANPVRHGSLALAAGTAGTYTLKGLKAGTAYTVHATVADAVGNVAVAAPFVATATTAAVPNLPGLNWSQMTLDAPCGEDPRLAFAPDGTPYVAFQSTALSGKLLVQRYAAGVWSPVGGATGLSTGAAYALQLAFAPDGTPYVAYYDTGLAGKAVVKRFTGGAWSAVGPDSGLSDGVVTALSLAFAPDGTPWLACPDGGQAGRVVVRRYAHGVWAAVGSATGVSNGTAPALNLAFGPTGIAYLASNDTGTGLKAVVRAYDASIATWLPMAPGFATTAKADRLSLATAPDGALYLGYRNSDTLNPSVAVYRPVALLWSDHSDLTAPSTWMDIAVGADGVPFLCYRDGISGSGYRAYVATYNGSTWVQTAPYVAAGEVSYPSLEVAPDGVPYVVCRDDTTHKVVVAKLASAINTVDVPDPDTYGAGQTLAFTVNYTVPVSITGTPRVPLTIGSTTRYADYTTTASTSTALRFLYTLQAGELDTDGVEVGYDLDLNGGTIVEASGWNASTHLSGVNDCSDLRVDAVAPETTITSHPANPSASASATFIFTGNDADSGVASFEARLDGGAFVAATSPVDITGLSDGAHTFAVRAIDAAGNVDTTPASYTWTVDTTAPAAPAITAITPTTVSGTAEPGASVEVFLSGTSLGTTTAGADGSWSLTISSLTDGDYSLTAQATDAALNTGTASTAGTYTVDTVAPALSVVMLLSDNAHDAALAKAGDTVALSFTASEALQAPTVTLVGESVTASYDSGTSTWTATHTVAAGDTEGAATFSIAYRDVAGNAGTTVSATTDSSAVTIDRTAPETTIDSAPGAWTGSLVMFEFAGEDGAGSGVASYEVSVNGADFAPATFREFFSDLPDGPYILKVRAIDAAGNVDATPAEHRWTVDTVAPTLTAVTLVSSNAVPTLAKAGDTVALSFAASETLRTPTVTLAGESVTASYDNESGQWRATHTVAAGDAEVAVTFSIAYRDESGLAGLAVTATTDSSAVTIDLTAPETTIDGAPGAWAVSSLVMFDFIGDDGAGSGVVSYVASLDGAAYASIPNPAFLSDLADGSHTLAVCAVDAAGNVDATPAEHRWTVDTIAPVAPTIASITSTGVSGRAEAGTTVEVFNGSTSLGTATADADGRWSLSVTLADGTYSLTATSTDTAGHRTSTAAATTRTVDTVNPTLTAVTLVSSNATPTLAKAGDTVALSFAASEVLQAPTVTLVGESVTATYDNASGQWRATHTVAAGDAESAVAFSIAYRDVAGNAGTAVTTTTDSSEVTIDLTAPDTAINGQPASLSASASATFTFGSADASASFEASLDGVAYAAATSPVSFTGLADGSHTFTVRAVDAAGNVDVTPATYAWTVDTIAPETTITSQPASLSGSVSATFAFNGTGAVRYEASLDGAAYASATSPATYTGLSEGAHTFEVRAIDAAGNVDATPASYRWTIDLTPPATPPSPEVPATPTQVSGRAEAGSTVTVYLNGVAAGTVQVGGDGTWAYALPPTLSEGEHEIAYTVTDAAGNVSVLSVATVFQVERLSRFAALSARAHAGAGEETLILGFVFAGNGKSTLVRGVGPGLADAVADHLADPQLRLYAADGTPVGDNDDWAGTPALSDAFARTGAGALAADSKDAALLATLPGRLYTAHVSGAAGGDGVALAEAYDADLVDTGGRLAALSVRSRVGTGDDILIAGFVITGEASKRVVVRGVGPGLAGAVSGALTDPALQVWKLNTATGDWVVVGENDDWDSTPATADLFQSLGMGALAAGSKDAAVVLALEPGIYTAQVRGVQGATGVGLVELYEAP
jgi:alpha-tubulin suppressor-like RCC1 family protein